jgi:ribonucleoside-diphosphate reductase alpha chain
MLRVLEQHRSATASVDEELAPPDLLEAAQLSWDEACERADRHGVRNSQATVLAPTGTIGLLMDCDTTGIEPDLGLVKSKRLVGGGTMEIVNTTIPRALRRLGYDTEQADEIRDHIAAHHTVEGSSLKPEHREVFACSLGDDTISASGHVKMMAAVQPFLSGAISKTVNMPASSTVGDVEQLFIDAWRLGLKSVAVYRDSSKVAQPLTLGEAGRSTDDAAAAVSDSGAGVAQPAGSVPEPVRRRLPRSRRSHTFEFRVADCKGFVTVGEYPDGRPGEIFVKVSKQGSTLAGIMDAFAISLSHGLQYGVPLAAFVETFVGVRFEPAGITDDPDIRIATSLMDYLFRKLAVMYLTSEERAALGVFTTDERTQPTLPGVEEQVAETEQGHDLPPDPPSIPSPSQLMAQLDFSQAAAPLEPPGPERPVNEVSMSGRPGPERPVSEVSMGGTNPSARYGALDAPFCMTCGVPMRRAGSCYVCADCGATSGCS